MTTTRLSIAAAFATTFASILPTTSAAAGALGEVVSISAVGEAFRVEFNVVSGTADELANCLRVVVPERATADLPWPRSGRVASSGRGASAHLIVTSSQTFPDPALRLGLSDVCSAHLFREYTLLLGDAPAAPISRSTSRAEVGAPPARAGSGTTWTMAPGESLEGLAHSLYPGNAGARQRFVAATRSANPDLFPDAASQRSALPAGTEVRIPDLREFAAGAPPAVRRSAAPASPPTNADSNVRTTATTEGSIGDRVVVEQERPATRTTGTDAGRAGNVADNSLREQELITAIDRSIAAEIELLARIAELERIEAELKERIHALTTQEHTLPEPAARPAAPAAPPPPVSPPAAEVSAPASVPHDWLLIGGLALAVLLLLALLLRRQRARPAVTREKPDDTPPPPQPLQRADAVPAQLDHAIVWTQPDEEQRTLPAPFGDGEHDSSEDHKSAVELADIMMSFGRLQGAAETLAEFIQGNPKQSIMPWLKLLDVYRAAGLRSEFEELSRQLNKTFNVRRVDWDNYDSLRNAALSLENMPHIITRLQSLWGKADCQVYIQQLLRDNRDGSRQGLPFIAIDELLLLEAMLEQEFGPYRPYSATPA